MIRAATLTDLEQLFGLVEQMHARSEYGARGIGLDPITTRALLKDAAFRNGRTNTGATHLNVVEIDGKLEGFMLGIFQRIYMICNRLEAQDMFLFCSERCPRMSASKLIAAYVDWAESNPKVAEIKLSWTDIAGADGAKLGALYGRKGFRRCGEVWTRVKP